MKIADVVNQFKNTNTATMCAKVVKGKWTWDCYFVRFYETGLYCSDELYTFNFPLDTEIDVDTNGEFVLEYKGERYTVTVYVKTVARVAVPPNYVFLSRRVK